MHDPSSYNLIPVLAQNRKMEVINFINTINRLSYTGEWLKSKKITPNSISYQRYLLQQNQFPSFSSLPNPQMFINQSLQLAPQNPQLLNEGFSMSNMANNRLSVSQNPNQVPVPYLNDNDHQIIPRNDINLSPINSNDNIKAAIKQELAVKTEDNKQSPDGGQFYDTTNEQIPLKKPKELDQNQEDSGGLQTIMEFGNEQFNSK